MSRKRNKFLIALIILLVAVIIGTLAYIVIKNLNESNERKSLENVAGSYASNIGNETTSGAESATAVTSPSINVKKVENPIDFKSLNSRTAIFILGSIFPTQISIILFCKAILTITCTLTMIFTRTTVFRAVFIRRYAISVIIPTG